MKAAISFMKSVCCRCGGTDPLKKRRDRPTEEKNGIDVLQVWLYGAKRFRGQLDLVPFAFDLSPPVFALDHFSRIIRRDLDPDPPPANRYYGIWRFAAEVRLTIRQHAETREDEVEDGAFLCFLDRSCHFG
jgi:hypothetical protein